jgi:hypothetical protein
MPNLLPDITDGMLVGCREKYGNCRINLPIDAHNIGPWVKISIEGGGTDLTVGNQSCPSCDPQHSAIIKSFEYGTSDGFVVKFVVHDQAGGSFDRFFKALNTDFCEITTDYKATATWGWTGVRCNEECVMVQSEPVTFLISSLSTNMSSGKIEYEVEGTDLFRQMMQSRAFKVIGDDANPVLLKEAIKQLFAEQPEPLVTDIQYLRRLPDGSTQPWEFKREPKCKWEPANRNKISIALDWMRPYLTDRDKGCIDYTWNAGGSTPGIIFWEDLSGRDVRCSSLGMYIVNGGALSPVISFQPKFQWNYTHLHRTGGVAGGGSTSAPADRKEGPGHDALGKKGAGVQIASQSIDHEDVIRCKGMGKEVQAENMDAEAKQQKTRTPLSFPVEADLVIQGDPTIVATQVLYKNHVSLIVINPFYLSGGSSSSEGGECPDWTINPPCNELGSNSKWQIHGVNHSISQGSYVTTLKLFLDTPGVDKPVGTPLGQNGPTG